MKKRFIFFVFICLCLGSFPFSVSVQGSSSDKSTQKTIMLQKLQPSTVIDKKVVSNASKENMLLVANRLLTIADKMSSQSARLEKRVQMLSTAPYEQQLIIDTRSQITQARTQVRQAITLLTSVPDDATFTANPSLKQARELLQGSYQSLNKARITARKIMVALVQKKETRVTPFSSSSAATSY
jgi:hypothetical protein